MVVSEALIEAETALNINRVSFLILFNISKTCHIACNLYKYVWIIVESEPQKSKDSYNIILISDFGTGKILFDQGIQEKIIH